MASEKPGRLKQLAANPLTELLGTVVPAAAVRPLLENGQSIGATAMAGLTGALFVHAAVRFDAETKALNPDNQPED